jgi:GT2 family glycosyltransferase
MKIAAITITYNDDYKFKEWVEHYNEYKDELFLHIIVDNGSKPEYLTLVEKTFVNSIIIKRITNGGCTSAYNDGIKLALSNPEVEAIMLIGNDIIIKTGSLKKLFDFLYSNEKYGMVSPILLEKDFTIHSFGSELSKNLYMSLNMNGKYIKDIPNSIQICSNLAGGMNLAKRCFYEKIGLQDENLFMYSDEIDIGIRAKKSGFLMAATKDVVAIHYHINQNEYDRRHPFSKYLIARNKVYLGRKHFGLKKTIYVFIYFFISGVNGVLIGLIKNNRIIIRDNKWQIFGAIAGLFNNMKENKYSSL